MKRLLGGDGEELPSGTPRARPKSGVVRRPATMVASGGTSSRGGRSSPDSDPVLLDERSAVLRHRIERAVRREPAEAVSGMLLPPPTSPLEDDSSRRPSRLNTETNPRARVSTSKRKRFAFIELLELLRRQPGERFAEIRCSSIPDRCRAQLACDHGAMAIQSRSMQWGPFRSALDMQRAEFQSGIRESGGI
jgi:hypothetical protein